MKGSRTDLNRAILCLELLISAVSGVVAQSVKRTMKLFLLRESFDGWGLKRKLEDLRGVTFVKQKSPADFSTVKSAGVLNFY
jgi:hypothetical protein